MRRSFILVQLLVVVVLGVWLYNTINSRSSAADHQRSTSIQSITSTSTASIPAEDASNVYIPAVDLIPALYIGSSESIQFYKQTFTTYHIHSITSLESINEISLDRVGIIYIDTDGLKMIDSDWLQQQLKSGIIIVGVNIPASKLTDILGVASRVDDLSLRDDGWILMTLINSTNSDTGSNSGMQSWYYRNFDEVVAVTTAAYHRYVTR